MKMAWNFYGVSGSGAVARQHRIIYHLLAKKNCKVKGTAGHHYDEEVLNVGFMWVFIKIILDFHLHEIQYGSLLLPDFVGILKKCEAAWERVGKIFRITKAANRA